MRLQTDWIQRFSYSRHRFPASIIQQSIWLYFRFSLSYRDVEDLLAERGIDVSYETVRRWALKFGSAYARTLRTSIYNTFYVQRHLISRKTLRQFRGEAMSEWQIATSAA